MSELEAVSWVRVCAACDAPEGDVKFLRCAKCVAEKLPNSCYCSKECQVAHWPTHKLWHKEQKLLREQHLASEARSVAIDNIKGCQEDADSDPGNKYARLIAEGSLAMQQQNLQKAEKKFRKAISKQPSNPAGYHNLAVTLSRANNKPEACTYAMLAADTSLARSGTRDADWAKSWGMACGLLLKPVCAAVEKPEWWTDAELLRLSALVVKVLPADEEIDVWQTRALVLQGKYHLPPLQVLKLRSASHIREAEKCLKRQAKLIPYMADTLLDLAARVGQQAAAHEIMQGMEGVSLDMF